MIKTFRTMSADGDGFRHYGNVSRWMSYKQSHFLRMFEIVFCLSRYITNARVSFSRLQCIGSLLQNRLGAQAFCAISVSRCFYSHTDCLIQVQYDIFGVLWWKIKPIFYCMFGARGAGRGELHTPHHSRRTGHYVPERWSGTELSFIW